MLTVVEKFLFFLIVIVTLVLTYGGVRRIFLVIKRGQGKPDWRSAWQKLGNALAKTVSLQPTFRLRLGPSFFHAMVAWGFMFYLLVNFGDILEAFFRNFEFLGGTSIAGPYRLAADVFSVGALVGMVLLLVRRFAFRPANLTAREDILLNPKARAGIRRDSLIVGLFILVHVGARFLGASFKVAASGQGDTWQPFASALAGAWSGLGETGITAGEHIGFWLAFATILAFLPYFPHSKHIHLFFAPINFLTKPKRRSMGELDKIDFDDESLEQFGATRLEDLGWEQLVDAYACIMCYRCQEVCPAYNTGKVLSPAALEINKRYFINYEGSRLAAGEASEKTLTEFAIPPEAIWACTACGACIDICPVGNEPMRDILDIRRSLVLMDNEFPGQLQAAFRGMERTLNPWNVPPTERMKWAQGYQIPTIEENPQAELLWWVGCAPATDARAQKTAQAFARVLNAAGVSFAVLGEQEQCTGDSARRAGMDYLFFELASANVEMLNEVAPKRIVTTCPHCLHTIKNEYAAFGGNYEVIHHTELINELLLTGQLDLQTGANLGDITFHDPCYLGRQNGIIDEPRLVLEQAGLLLNEMPRHGAKSFCCGAGGAQMWKEEEEGTERVSSNRVREAQATGAAALAVGCPFCMIMLTDAGKQTDSELPILDVAEIVANALPEADE
ncbi:MAG: (Fe-S)-binding protein [Anaerolineales bacterium]